MVNFVSNFLDISSLKSKKKIYTSRLRKGLKAHQVSTVLTISSIMIHCRLIKKCLGFHPSYKRREGLEI